MMYNEDNIIVTKSQQFAVRIVRLERCLVESRCERTISKQILKSGTSIGANISEAIQAQSRADFVSKMGIALKEESETEYWLKLLHNSGCINDKEFQSLIADCQELGKLLTSIIKTTKQNDINRKF